MGLGRVTKDTNMRKKAISISKQVEYATLYLDDLEDIYNLLGQASSKINFEIDDYVLDSFEDLMQLRKTKTEKLELRIIEPHVNLSIDTHGASVYADDCSAISENITLKIINILEKRKNRFIEFVDRHLYKIAVPVVLLGGLSVTFYNLYYPIVYVALTLLIIGCFLFVFSGLITISKLSKTKFLLTYKKDKPSFFERNKDEIIKGIILLIFGAIIKSVFDYFF